MQERKHGEDIAVRPDAATLSAAKRAARDGQARHLLVVQGESGGTMTYGTLFTSDSALSAEATMLRKLGQDAPLFALTAGADGAVSVRRLAA